MSPRQVFDLVITYQVHIYIVLKYIHFVLHHILSVDVTPSITLELISLYIVHYMYNNTPGRMQVGCGSWVRWLVSRTRSCADKLGGGRERDPVQRKAKRYDNDGHGKYVGLRLLLLAAAIMAVRVLPSQTNRQTSNDKEKRHGAKILAALRRVSIRSFIVCF